MVRDLVHSAIFALLLLVQLTKGQPPPIPRNCEIVNNTVTAYICIDSVIEDRDQWKNEFIENWKSLSQYPTCILTYPIEVEFGSDFGRDCTGEKKCYQVDVTFESIDLEGPNCTEYNEYYYSIGQGAPVECGDWYPRLHCGNVLCCEFNLCNRRRMHEETRTLQIDGCLPAFVEDGPSAGCECSSCGKLNYTWVLEELRDLDNIEIRESVVPDSPEATYTLCDETKNGGGGGDPHIKRWNQKHNSFHGECDMVFLSSKGFHDGTGLELHVRATIETYFSFFEAAALRIGGSTLELYNEEFFVDGKKHDLDSLPFVFGTDSRYTLDKAEIEGKINTKYHSNYKLSWRGGKSQIIFKFYKKFLTISVTGHAEDFEDSVGLLGDFHTGSMIDRHGKEMYSFQEYGFEWQVEPKDPKLFMADRSPQLPYERCRLPTSPRPQRVLKREEHRLQEEAFVECATAEDMDLCVLDVMNTGDIGLASLWVSQN